jgi:hypothetical protein
MVMDGVPRLAMAIRRVKADVLSPRALELKRAIEEKTAGAAAEKKAG